MLAYFLGKSHDHYPILKGLSDPILIEHQSTVFQLQLLELFSHNKSTVLDISEHSLGAPAKSKPLT